jgi:hypothetical protein
MLGGDVKIKARNRSESFATFSQDQCFSISFFEGNGHEHGADAKRKELLAGHEIKKLVSFKQRRRV